MVFERELGIEIADIFKNTFGSEIEPDKLVFQATRKEFPGDITLVVFNLSKSTGKKPEEVGEVIGNELVSSGKWICGFNVVKGFLNIEINRNGKSV